MLLLCVCDKLLGRVFPAFGCTSHFRLLPSQTATWSTDVRTQKLMHSTRYVAPAVRRITLRCGCTCANPLSAAAHMRAVHLHTRGKLTRQSFTLVHHPSLSHPPYTQNHSAQQHAQQNHPTTRHRLFSLHPTPDLLARWFLQRLYVDTIRLQSGQVIDALMSGTLPV